VEKGGLFLLLCSKVALLFSVMRLAAPWKVEWLAGWREPRLHPTTPLVMVETPPCGNQQKLAMSSHVTGAMCGNQ
jgi:hypothetical protein